LKFFSSATALPDERGGLRGKHSANWCSLRFVMETTSAVYAEIMAKFGQRRICPRWQDANSRDPAP